MTNTPTTTLADLLDRAWAEIVDTYSRRGGFGGLLTLATVGPDGGPESRLVVARRADRTRAEVEVFTDATTAKVGQIKLNDRVALLIWNATDRLQIRARGRADVVTGAAGNAAWQAMNTEQRRNYGTVPPPGTPIARPDAFGRLPDRQRLAILRIALDSLDLVRLDRPDDLRAIFQRVDGWRGQWVAP